MDDREITRLLEKAVFWEDEFILKYDSNVFWELLRALPAEKAAEMESILRSNLSDTRRHRDLLSSLVREMVGKEDGK